MNPQTPAQTPATIYWLIRGVWLEILRRREIPVVGLFMALFIIGALIARYIGAETDAAAAFILNLGLSLAWILSLILSIIIAGRQFPDELEQRTIYPLLAKPVARAQYILAKWLAITIAGSATAVILSILALLASPWPSSLSPGLLIQSLFLLVLAIGTATAITIALSIRLPKAIAYVISILIVFAGGQFAALVTGVAGTGKPAVRWLSGYIPDFARLDLTHAFTQGLPTITLSDLLLRIFYAFAITAFALAVATVLLERKPL